jgi:hydroxyethylthiazole kinase-like uncharacterized protein yjeF
MSFPAYAHPILSSSESQAFEKRLFQEKEALEWKAMNLAGATIARQTAVDMQECLGGDALQSILTLVGKGHNGGDAIIATRHLLSCHDNTHAYLVFPSGLSHLRPLVQRSLEDLQISHGSRLSYLSIRQGGVESVQNQLNRWLDGKPVDLCLDGILGMQFRPPLRSPIRELIEAVNSRNDSACRIAIDVPSGVGDESDTVSFKADFSYATGIAKEGLFSQGNRPSVGRIRYLDLGFFDKELVASTYHVLSEEALGFRRALRPAQINKRTQGHVFVLGGSATMPGAIVMSVQAALQSGVGLVTAFVPESIVAEAALRLPEAMWVGLPQIPDAGGLALEGLSRIRNLADRATGWVMGPGLGRNPESATLVEEVIALSKAPVLLDADALQVSLARRNWADRLCVITPHTGEFNRLLQRPLGEAVDAGEVASYARENGCVVLLKGSPTLITNGEQFVYSCFGGPVLARGGSGDILSGLVGGRMAIPGTDGLESVCQAASWHGWAADRLARARGQTAVKVTDLLDFL